jgi:hypothetical protein
MWTHELVTRLEIGEIHQAEQMLDLGARLGEFYEISM